MNNHFTGATDAISTIQRRAFAQAVYFGADLLHKFHRRAGILQANIDEYFKLVIFCLYLPFKPSHARPSASPRCVHWPCSLRRHVRSSGEDRRSPLEPARAAICHTRRRQRASASSPPRDHGLFGRSNSISLGRHSSSENVPVCRSNSRITSSSVTGLQSARGRRLSDVTSTAVPAVRDCSST